METPGRRRWLRTLTSREVCAEHLKEAVGTRLHLATVSKPLRPCLMKQNDADRRVNDWEM